MKPIEYNKLMREAYIGTPDRYEWYSRAFDSFEKNPKGAGWYWNSWAMVGGFWYFLYRKQLGIAMIILAMIVILGVVLSLKFFLFIYLILSIAMGGFGTYFIYVDYKSKREDMERLFKDDKPKCLGVMHIIAGVNRVAIYASIVTLVSLVLILFGLWTISDNGDIPT
jgi:hypothetical protein